MTLDLDRFKRDLEVTRERLVSARAAVNHEGSLTEESGDLSAGVGDHLADTASETYMRELDEGLEENADHLLGEVDAALVRIQKGTFGKCLVCGKPIDEDRLEAVPYATLCIDDQRAAERR
jgi:RNA polymerase-binding transcription factor DksA